MAPSQFFVLPLPVWIHLNHKIIVTIMLGCGVVLVPESQDGLSRLPDGLGGVWLAPAFTPV